MKKRLTVILIALAIGCIPCALAQEDGWDSMIRSTDGSADVSAIHLPEFDAPKFNADPQMDVNPLPTEAPTDVPAPVTPDPGEEPVLPGEPQPTVNPLPTPEPTAKPTAVPTAEPTPEPTAKPTAEPTARPTAVPTAEPTPEPTAKPTPKPTAEPTAVPTDEPAPITPAPEEEPVLTAEPQPTVNPLPTAEPECPHNFERIIDSVSSTLVNQNDRKHSVDVVCHDRCTLCGAETARRRETILEAHRFSDKGQMEAVHQNGLGHAYYDLCACGAARYTGSYGTLDSCRICKPTSSMNDSGKINWKDHAHVDIDFQRTPTDGNIRYVSQYSGDAYYHNEYWAGVSNPGSNCTWAAHSMMLSYFGIDVLPTDIQSKMNELATGKYLAAINDLIADTGITSIRAVEGHEESAIGNGIKKGEPVGKYGTVWVSEHQETNMYDRLHEMYDNYSTDPSYSPIMLYMWRYRSSTNDYGPHAVVIIGQDPDDKDVFYVANPGDSRHVYKIGFQRDNNGVLRVDASKSVGLANDNNAVVEISQYKR